MNSSRTDKVCEYFRPNIREWDVNKVQQTFHEDDVRCILQVRIPQNQVADRVAWLNTTDGRYSVKSGYHHCYNEHHNMLNEIPAKGWNRLWNLNIPPKTKFFLWRLCRNNIPVRYLIRGKGVITTIVCPMCNLDVEHLLHIFFDCVFARKCWLKSGITSDMETVESAPEWLIEKLGTESEE